MGRSVDPGLHSSGPDATFVTWLSAEERWGWSGGEHPSRALVHALEHVWDGLYLVT